MKRVFSIVMALALALTMVIGSALPASAAGSVTVTPSNKVAFESSNWTITFTVEAGLTVANDDYIDVYFPAGMNLTGIVVDFDTAATRALAIVEPYAFPGTPANLIGASVRQVRIDVPTDVMAGALVALRFVNVVNPTSCFHTVTIVQSNCCTTVSPEFPIYSIKMDLVKGKNLISLPSYPEDEAIEVVFADLFARAALTATATVPFEFEVWYWDAEAQVWLKYVSDTSFSEITIIEPGKAYWVKVNEAISFFFKGESYPECQGPPQKFCWYVPSWNMVGFASLVSMNASAYLKNAMLPWPQATSYAVSAIYSFNSATQLYVDETWAPGLVTEAPWKGGPGDATLVAGKGYFMSFLADACIIPPIQ